MAKYFGNLSFTFRKSFLAWDFFAFFNNKGINDTIVQIHEISEKFNNTGK